MNSRLDQLNKLLNRYYRYVVLAAVGVITLVMLNWFIWPQYQLMGSAGTLQYRHSTDVVAQRKAYLTQLQSMQTEYEQLDQRIVRAIDIALPIDYSAGPVYAEMDHLLDGTQFKITSVNVAGSQPIEGSVYEELSISLNVTANSDTASYADFKALLQRIEHSAHVMNLESIVYTPNSPAYTLVLKTYQRTQPL